ncbi:hypothetical protein Tco_0541441 [Tanacetum coccineum]
MCWVWRGVLESKRERGRGVKEKQHGSADDSSKEIDYGNKAMSSTPDADMNMGNLCAELNTLRNNSRKPTEDRADIAMHLNVESPKACSGDNTTGPISMLSYSWGRSSYVRAMVELRADVELKDTLVVVVPKFMGEVALDVLKNLKKHSEAQLQFKPTKQVYQPVSKKNGASSSGTKKQDGLIRQETSTSNSFDALNAIENDDELGKNKEEFKVG